MSDINLLDLYQQVSEKIPQSVKDKISQESAKGLTGLLVQSAGIMINAWMSRLLKRGLTAQAIEERSHDDEAYTCYVARIISTITREQVKEKLEAWADILLSIHLGQLKDPICIDLYLKLLNDCVLQDLVLLGYLYKKDVPENEPITHDQVNDFPVEQLTSTLQRLSAFGLVKSNLDSRSKWASGDKPNLADIYYTRNQIGKDFLKYIGEYKTNPEPK